MILSFPLQLYERKEKGYGCIGDVGRAHARQEWPGDVDWCIDLLGYAVDVISQWRLCMTYILALLATGVVDIYKVETVDGTCTNVVTRSADNLSTSPCTPCFLRYTSCFVQDLFETSTTVHTTK